jgi:hypothetical protein
MWFYEQERQERADPKNAVRANAEYRSEQRRRRLAALQWFGYSNSRPLAAVTPYTSTTPSPQWGANHFDPYLWSGTRTVYLPTFPYWY